MNKNISITSRILFSLLISVLLISFAIATNVNATWTGCCTTNNKADFSGVYDTNTNCCYSFEDKDQCCTFQDAWDSGCYDTIDCPTCPPSDPEEPEPDPCVRCTLSKCPNPPLADSGPDELKFKDFLYCKDKGDCSAPTEHWGDCYEIPSVQPSVSLDIYPTGEANSYGFSSSTHTGVRVVDDISINEPIRMVGRYTDSTADEIEALYIWFSDTGAPTTPIYVNLDNLPYQSPKTTSRSQFGFMLHREGTSWKPYIPSMGFGEAGDKWVKPNFVDGNKFWIIGPDGKKMVLVENLGVSKGSPTRLDMNFTLSFNNNDPVLDKKYNIFMQGNDVFGFTPYDNYTSYKAINDIIGDYWAAEKIRYPNIWKDTNKDWYVDLTHPEILELDYSIIDKSKIQFAWNMLDKFSLYGVVGNLYISETEEVSDFRVTELSPAGGEPAIPFLYVPDKLALDTKIGHLEIGKFFKVISINGSGSVTIDPLDNRKGVLIFYITGFDKAGNMVSDFETFDLRDWMITKGGLLYSKAGVDVSIRKFNEEDSGLWDGTLLFIKKFLPLRADITTELVGDQLEGGEATPPVKSNVVDSYMVRKYEVRDEVSYYYNLKSLFDKKASFLPIVKRDVSSPLTGNLVNTAEVGIRLIEEDSLTIGNFVCNGKGIFFIKGDLTLNGNITNTNVNRDACIFVVGGNVNIKKGALMSSGTTIGFDQINGYIFSDGNAIIEAENPPESDTSSMDSLLIEGGLHSLLGVEMNRYLKLGDRFVYPAFTVNHHSKYGIFAGELFGSQVNIQKVEVGIKPF